MNIFAVWLQFIISAGLVIFGGFYLARNGKELGNRYGLTDIWVGFIFLAAVTSIPELATALGAVMIAGSPALALSDVLGSNAFNLFIIAAIGICWFRRPVTAGLTLAPFRLMILMIVLMSGLVLGFAVLNREDGLFSPGRISLASWAVIIVYLVGSWKLFRDEHPAGEPRRRADRGSEQLSARALYLRIAVSIILVVGGGFWLARSGREIAEITQWGDSFVGALFLAMITSLPEVSVCLAAIKMGSNEMALGNILGSNIFNLGIIFWADLAYRKGNILTGMEGGVYVSGVMSVVLVGLTAAALYLKAETSGRLIAAVNIAISLLYLAGMYWIFRISAV